MKNYIIDITTIAENISSLILSFHKKDIEAIGIFGSLSDYSHSCYSDIDIVVISKIKIKNKFFVLTDDNYDNCPRLDKDVKVSIFFKTVREAFSSIKESDELDWPIKNGKFLKTRAIYDPKLIFKKFSVVNNKNKITKSGHTKFLLRAGKWLSIAYEFLGKTNNPKNDDIQTRFFAREFVFCLINYLNAIDKNIISKPYDILFEIKNLRVKYPAETSLMFDLVEPNVKTSKIKLEEENLWRLVCDIASKHNISIVNYPKNEVNAVIKNILK